MLYFINKMLCEEPVENFSIGGKVRGYAFKIRLNNYRGTNLSCIQGLTVKVDGQAVPQEAITFCLNHKRFAIHELMDQYKEYWYVLDKAVIEVEQPGGLDAGSHEFEVTLTCRSPSAGYSEDKKYPVMPTTEIKTLQVLA